MDKSKRRLAISRLTTDLYPFTSAQQNKVLGILVNSEEGDHYADKILEYADRIATMPKTYDQDGLGMDAIAHLHYFVGGSDFFITEKDIEGGVDQAFGLARMHGGEELGYLSIAAITDAGAELDLHWTPKPLKECK